MSFPDDAETAIGTGDDSSMDSVAASIAAKLGGGDRPRDESGRFLPVRDTAPVEDEEPTPESGEPDEGEADEGDLPDEGDQQTEEVEQPQKFTVKVQGEEVAVTLDELQKGYSREADYTRSKQALAAEKATWEATREASLKAEREALAAEREQAKQALTGWQQFIEAQFGNKDYWDNLYQQDPARWSAEQLKLERQMRSVQEQQSKLQKEDAEKREADLRAKRTTEFQKLVQAVPEWSDQAKLNEGYQKLASYAVQVRGYTHEDLQSLAYDHRLALVLKDAAAFHALQQKKPEIAPKLKDIKPVKPGAVPSTPARAQQAKKVAERFAKTGRVDDLASHLERKFSR